MSSEPPSPFSVSHQEFSEIHEEFRELKHRINNTLAIVMALSELSQRNPAYFERLAQTVLQRGPEMVSTLAAFQNRLAEKLGLPTDEEPNRQPPGTSA